MDATLTLARCHGATEAMLLSRYGCIDVLATRYRLQYDLAQVGSATHRAIDAIGRSGFTRRRHVIGRMKPIGTIPMRCRPHRKDRNRAGMHQLVRVRCSHSPASRMGNSPCQMLHMWRRPA
jgi:hypothetical protein